ncbi:transcription-repair coupling factor [uncultured Ilyobacter sp.]|uniref:transcription-repair coupling factor n=1 Tax=uncultured Ilyobacter sp. TaxID=544433 RepID=UPI002AA733CE|nr:transcription-repair coupling factor [uncultured Ilyobacter sp.]
MFNNMKFNKENMYRGAVPFFLMNRNKKIVYISSSNKNIEDYYFTLSDYYKESVYKIENFNYSDEEFQTINYGLLKILENRDNWILLVSLEGILKDYFTRGEQIQLCIEKEYDLKLIEEKLVKNGFRKNYLVEKRWEYSRRGDILDIYPPNGENPVRIEFFGDEVERISYFNIETQKSIENLDEINVYINNNKDGKTTFSELLEKMVSDEMEIYLENRELMDYKLEEFILRNRDSESELRNKYSDILEKTMTTEIIRFQNEDSENYQDYENVKKIAAEKKVIIMTEEEKRYKEIFLGTPINIVKEQHYEGFMNENTLVLTDRELKGIRIRRTDITKDSVKYTNINQIRPGDYIIHDVYGVGIYLGIEKIDENDYLSIRYAGEDKLYVPVTGLNRIEKYICEKGSTPEIYNLGRRGFRKRREKLQKDIMEFAKELIEIQAKRQSKNGFAFSKDTVWQEEFEEGFPYNETKDQLRSIEEVKQDMESHIVMDRIVCGDVGYGKTEVAMRAAFKALMDGKQVVVMAPTTVLASQHYQRFLERFKNYPIEISLLSRLKSDKDQNEIIKKLKAGTVDLVIGTHRILSKDVGFKNLGLVVIDEEQKFGVKAKEKLKHFRANVDMLTLTATPIPRTLNLAFLGIRDISIIQTPPPNRLPVETKFIEKTKENIREAVMKEVAREGQIFYLFNSVKNMKRKLEEIEAILPKYVKTTYIHGQMTPNEIRDRIKEFEDGEVDVLLSTTIIENGIDIENANTIIIENLDKLGLSQVYQLRGRVGRGSRKAYCYLVVDKDKKMTKKGEQRKDSLENIGVFGAGFQLSMEDMRIRGAGEILGEKQHGALETLGYDLYLKLLDEEVRKVKGEEILPDDVDVDLGLDSNIPTSYIDESEKIVIYKRLLMVDSTEEIEDIKSELVDRFGKMPDPVKNLFYYLEVKLLARQNFLKGIKKTEEGYLVKFLEEKLDFDKVHDLISKGEVIYVPKEEGIRYKGDILEFLLKFKD